MMKIKIRVFPDYCSSGLWGFPPNHTNLDESQFADIIPEIIMIALKYWHRVWELTADYMAEDGVTSMSMSYRKKWDEDGQKIVDAMNKCQSEYEFIYEPSFEESEK